MAEGSRRYSLSGDSPGSKKYVREDEQDRWVLIKSTNDAKGTSGISYLIHIFHWVKIDIGTMLVTNYFYHSVGYRKKIILMLVLLIEDNILLTHYWYLPLMSYTKR